MATVSSADTSVVQRPTLSTLDAVAIIVGIVVGAGIYEVPSLVASNATSIAPLLLVWVLGGFLSFLGAVCYAELTTTYPDAGGNYYYLRRAFGPNLAFLFAWARLAVIQTGSIALLGFVFGDYASQIFRLGEYSSAIYAALAVVAMTTLNIMNVHFGRWLQRTLTLGTLAGLIAVIIAGFFMPDRSSQAAATQQQITHSNFGLMMIFVLLSYGGWSEAAFISAELKDVRRKMVPALLGSIGLITAMYILVNLALVRGLGLTGMARSEAVGAELMRNAFGQPGAVLLSLAAMFAALSSMHGSLFTGARTNYALGRDYALFRMLGYWDDRGNTPTRALGIQGIVALGLVFAGAATREGFRSMVEFTAPVFWLFILLTGVSLIVLRTRDPGQQRRFRVPGYPVTPILFCATSAYLVYASVAYTGLGSLLGVAVLLVGVGLLYIERIKTPMAETAGKGREAA